jgi:hypothetical protein
MSATLFQARVLQAAAAAAAAEFAEACNPLALQTRASGISASE